MESYRVLQKPAANPAESYGISCNFKEFYITIPEIWRNPENVLDALMILHPTILAWFVDHVRRFSGSCSVNFGTILASVSNLKSTHKVCGTAQTSWIAYGNDCIFSNEECPSCVPLTHQQDCKQNCHVSRVCPRTKNIICVITNAL